MAYSSPTLLHTLKSLALAIVAAVLVISTPASAQGDIEISNEHIAITVNNSGENTGRFSVSTTGGDPDQSGDDNKHLIYRRPGQSPWTSYTTMLIDGKPWVFGGTTRDAGKDGSFGVQKEVPRKVDSNLIRTAWQLGPLLAVQEIRIVRSSTTGLLDTAAVTYTLTNTDSVAHDIGLRVALDTMLGENDGAPFRVADQAVTTDTVLSGASIPDFWQAFDSLADPKVTAQGTLRGGEVSTPDKVYFTNWGSIANGVWNLDFSPGRDFTRQGEFDLDSATALMWEPVRLQPQETRSYVVHYGLGGMSIAPGQLQIGIAAQTSIVAQTNSQFQVVAYIMNRGSGEARNVKTELRLPNGLALAPGQSATRTLGNLPVNGTAQVKWDVRLAGGTGQLSYSVAVEALNANSNELTRRIDVIAPAKLSVKLAVPEGRLTANGDSWLPQKYLVTATITNTGQASAVGVTANWSSERGLKLAAGDGVERYIGTLEPGQQKTVRWHIVPDGSQPGNLPFAVKAASGSNGAAAYGLLLVPPLDALVELEVWRIPESATAPLRVGDTFMVAVLANNLAQGKDVRVEVTYDPTKVQLLNGTLGVEAGTIFVSTAGNNATLKDWSPVKHWIDVSKPLARVALGGMRQANTPASGTVAVLYMQAKAAGTTTLTIDKLTVLDSSGQQCTVAGSGSTITFTVVP